VNIRHLDYWREHARDPALTALLVVQGFILLVAAPAAAMGNWSGRIVIELAVLALAVVVFVISHGRVPTAIAVFAIACGVGGAAMQLRAPSHASSLLGTIGSFGAQLLVIYLLGRAVLAPGEITRHRVVGAIALYLGLGMVFAGAYRLAFELVTGSLTNVASKTELFQSYSSILYFSFVTLTSVGYGDIVPVHPFVRALCNLEAIIGQLYPATLLARLVTLELDRHRR
jgi:Ion channel